MALDVVEDAVVDERQPPRRASLDLVDRPLPRVEVDLRRWRRCEDEPARGDSDPGRVAVVERPVLVLVRDLVRGVARRRETREADDVVADDANVRLRHGLELAPELVEGFTVQPPRARLEPGRVDEVRRADLGDVDGQCRMLPDERAGGSRVVEVDVREEQVLHVAELDAARRERVAQRGKAARRAAVEERETVLRLDEVGGDAARVTAVEEVEGLVRHAGDGSRVSRTVAAGGGL